MELGFHEILPKATYISILEWNGLPLTNLRCSVIPMGWLGTIFKIHLFVLIFRNLRQTRYVEAMQRACMTLMWLEMTTLVSATSPSETERKKLSRCMAASVLQTQPPVILTLPTSPSATSIPRIWPNNTCSFQVTVLNADVTINNDPDTGSVYYSVRCYLGFRLIGSGEVTCIRGTCTSSFGFCSGAFSALRSNLKFVSMMIVVVHLLRLIWIFVGYVVLLTPHSEQRTANMFLSS